MSRKLFWLLLWCSHHRVLACWSFAALIALGGVGGAVAGAAVSTTLPVPTTDATRAEGATDQKPVARIATVGGILIAARDSGLVLLTDGQRTLVIPTDLQTKYRRGGESVQRSELRRGQRVTVVGRVLPNDRLRARIVSLRGEPLTLPVPPAASAAIGERQ